MKKRLNPCINIRQKPIGILYSGGLDSQILAALAAQNIESKIELVNVAFGESPLDVPDRITAINGFLELRYAGKLFEPKNFTF